MNRRTLIALFGGAAAWSVAARAQQAMPVVGFLSNLSPDPIVRPLAAFRRGLSDTGYSEALNVIIEYRWAEGRNDLLPRLAAELVERRMTVIVATGGGTSALAAKAATDTIPIVFSTASDPVQLGLVASLNRPGGNATGVSVLANSLDAKRLELIHELIPNDTLAVLLNPEAPGSNSQLEEVTEAASKLEQKIRILNASTDNDLQAASAVLGKGEFRGLLVTADPFFNSRRERLVEIAARHALPAIYEFREFAAAGGLITYGTDLSAAYREIGLYTGRILKGEKPSDLPVLQPTKFELVINLKTAKGLDLEIPPTLLARADEVIE